MPPPKSSIPAAATPVHSAHFDAWNSSSTGHQRAENRLSTSTGWRQSRAFKLSHQLKSGLSGGPRVSDQVGAGSDRWDENLKGLIPPEVRARAQLSVAHMLRSQRSKEHKNSYQVNDPTKVTHTARSSSEHQCDGSPEYGQVDRARGTQHEEPRPAEGKKGIFDGLVVYVNGSTYPHISDHKLKHLLSCHGARLSIHVARRQVTHIILGDPSHSTTGRGAGGGLASSKIQDFSTLRACGIKFVSVEW
jgi:hypothetical protein